MFCKNSIHPFNNEVHLSVKGNLGSLITDQMYNGVSSSNSTLLTGEFDDEDSFDVDPLCDMSTDKFSLSNPISSSIPTSVDE